MGVLSPVSIVSEIVFKSAWNAKVKKKKLQTHQHNPFHILFQVKWLTTFVLRLQSVCVFLWHSNSLYTLCPALAQALPSFALLRLCSEGIYNHCCIGGLQPPLQGPADVLTLQMHWLFQQNVCCDKLKKYNFSPPFPKSNNCCNYIYSTLANISFDQ